MAHRIYHWKHGWIPLDHVAALSKAKGRETGARRYLAASHAAGHAHDSVVTGSFAGGTHERGLQPVAAEHLPRERHIIAAFSPGGRRFGLLDTQASATTSIPEHLAEHFNAKNYKINRVEKGAAGDRIHVETPSGAHKTFKADGSDKHIVDPHMIDPPRAAPKAPKATSVATNAYSGSLATHTVAVRNSGERNQYGVVKKIGGTTMGSIGIVDHGLAQHLMNNDHKVIGYHQKKITTIAPDGITRRFADDGSNLSNPTIVKTASIKTPSAIGGWAPISHSEIEQGSHPLPAIVRPAQGGVYRKGNKTVVLEPRMTDAQRTAFLGHVDQAFEATGQHTDHAIIIHVPNGDRQFKSGRTLGYVYSGDSTRVHISPKVAWNSADTGLVGGNADGGWKMAARTGVHPTLYTLTHELGHIVDNKNSHTRDPNIPAGNGGWMPGATTREAHSHHANARGGLSTYGKTNPAEGYAEAFAHHHLASHTESHAGHTHNAQHDQGAEQYAKRYGWTPNQGWAKAPASAVADAARHGNERAIAEAKRRHITLPR